MLEDLPKRRDLERLQRDGVVFLAPLATRAWILAAVFAMILVFGGRVYENLVVFGYDWSAVRSEPGQVLKPYFLAAAVLSGVTLVVGVLTTLLQTRGTVSVSMLQTTKRLKVQGLALTLPLQILIVATAALLGAYWLLPQALQTMRHAVGVQIEAHFGELVAKVCKLVVVVAFVLAILVMFGSRLVFLFKHRKRRRAEN